MDSLKVLHRFNSFNSQGDWMRLKKTRLVLECEWKEADPKRYFQKARNIEQSLH